MRGILLGCASVLDHTKEDPLRLVHSPAPRSIYFLHQIAVFWQSAGSLAARRLVPKYSLHISQSVRSAMYPTPICLLGKASLAR